MEQEFLPWKPTILRAANQKEWEQVQVFRALPGVVVSDLYRDNFRELLIIRDPQRYFSGNFEHAFNTIWNEKTPEEWEKEGVWIWYPWRHSLVHTLPESDFVQVRSSRNRLLISDEEQIRFREAHIGIAGLSVGFSIALTLVLEGGGKYLKLADHDTLDLSNLNRIPMGLCDVGSPKLIAVARRLYEIDPFLELELYPEGLTRENIAHFMNELELFVDEVDNLSIKKVVRGECAKRRIPLVMATDNEETGMIDVERYDVEDNIQVLRGVLDDYSHEALSLLTKRESGKLIAQIVGDEFTTDRMRSSLEGIGKEVVSWPQIGGTALLNGGSSVYVIRALLNDQPVSSGRYSISLPKIFS